MSRLVALVALVCSATAIAAAPDISKMNGSIRIDRGQQAGDLSTLNGSITIEQEASVRDVSTVNGSVRVGERASVGRIEAVNGEILLRTGASARSLQTVNGEIEVREEARVDGDVAAVNGELDIARRVEIAGNVENVNGKIEIEGATVNGRVETVVGDVEIGAGSRIAGGLRVERPDSWHGGQWNRRGDRPPRIVIGPDAIVEGSLVFEHEVRLYISDRATVGSIEGATPVRFSGARP